MENGEEAKQKMKLEVVRKTERQLHLPAICICNKISSTIILSLRFIFRNLSPVHPHHLYSNAVAMDVKKPALATQ